MSKIPDHGLYDGIISSIRGYRNGIITASRIRMPYVLQSLIYAIIFRKKSDRDRVKFVLKQLLHHGMNLGCFVGIYKFICVLCRNSGIKGGPDAWIAGMIGGYIAFGESSGISGSVNNQIVLYLFARGVEGALRSFASRGIIPSQLDLRTPGGFRLFAGFSLALILYLTEYEPNTLKSGFITTMDELYYHSNSGPMPPPPRFAIPVALISFCLIIGSFSPQFRLETFLNRIEKKLDWTHIRTYILEKIFGKQD
ncbi:peroxisomal membrane protein Pxmp4 [Acrasis kona]|uniref:Peroxisomal membrane protein Pxmp4 n=1 Tax=Acrasis kona TaxID=1008807 RepID=A0AAW2Z339_9EUKA